MITIPEVVTDKIDSQVGRQLAAALVGQVVLLGALAAVAGVGPIGVLAGAAYIVGLCVLLARAVGPDVVGLGPANLVTLTRAVLVGGVIAQVVDGFATGGVRVPVLVVIATVALILDGVDGQVARRTHTVTATGARFDMEVDSILLLVLSVHVAPVLGLWVLAIGLMRYAWVAASWLLPWLRAPLPTRHSGKAVAVLQAVALVLAASGLIPPTSAAGVLAVALGLLIWSFGHSGVWLWQRRPGRPRVRSTAHAEPEAQPGRSALRPLLITGLATALVLAVLIMPNQPGEVGRGMLHLPVEGVLIAAALLMLPGRAGRVLAVIAGVALGVSSVLTVLDIGFLAVLARPFDPIVDWVLADSVVDLLAGSLGRRGAVAALAAFAVIVTALLVAVIFAVRRSAAALVRQRNRSTRVVGLVVPVCLISLVLGAQIVPGVPVASANVAASAVERAQRLIASSAEHRAFEAACATDPLNEADAGSLLAGLRGKDVVVAFVESYGRDSIEYPGYAATMGATLDNASRRLTAAGFDARSGYLTSPVSGGGSWLAHTTFLSGLWTDNERRYATLTSSERGTVVDAFHREGWRTVAVMPGNTEDWPEAEFYDFDQVLDHRSLGYRGPDLGWASTPDQYSLAVFQQAEHGAPGRGPLFAEIALVSSHAPWPIIPDVIAWDRVGDGSVYHSMTTGEPRDAIWAKGNDAVRTAYRRSLEYSISSLISWMETYGSEDTVLIMVGDHQPAPFLTGPDAGRDVPITIISGDQAVLDPITDWGWSSGIRPESAAPVWRMDTFRDRFLSAYQS